MDLSVSQSIQNKIDSLFKTGNFAEYFLTLTIKEWNELTNIILMATPVIKPDNKDWSAWATRVVSHINSIVPKL